LVFFITNVARNESFVRKATETADSRKLGLKVQIDFDKKTGIFEWSLQIAMALFVSQKIPSSVINGNKF